MTRKNFISYLVLALIGFQFCVSSVATAQDKVGEPKESEEGFKTIFDGKTLDGWKINESPDSWKIENGEIIAKGPRSHLFYVGEGQPFKDFHLKIDVKTTPGSNAGIYFHTKFQEEGWPKYGYECQVNISHGDPKKSAGLYSVEDVFEAPAKDNEWYTQEIIVKGRHIITKVNGKTIVDYTEPENKAAFSNEFERRLGTGTIALQAHDPESKVYFKNIRIKSLD